MASALSKVTNETNALSARRGAVGECQSKIDRDHDLDAAHFDSADSFNKSKSDVFSQRSGSNAAARTRRAAGLPSRPRSDERGLVAGLVELR